MSRKLTDLAPDVLPVAAEWLRVCNAMGVPVLVYDTLRTETQQARLYTKGRTAPGRIVTNAKPGESWHQYGVAWDAVPWDLAQGTPVPSKLDWTPFPAPASEAEFERTGEIALLEPAWQVMVRAAEQIGIEWAGRWARFREYVHWQYARGRSIADLREAA